MKNSVWYLADKGGRALLNLVLFVFVTRALGAEGLGKVSLGLAWLALVASLGAPAIETWLIAQWPKIRNDGTAAIFQLAFWTHTVFTGLALICFVFIGSFPLAIACMAAAGLFRSSDIFRTYLEANGLAKKTVLYEGIAFTLSAVAKCICIVYEPRWEYFGAAFALETVAAWPLLYFAVKGEKFTALQSLFQIPVIREWRIFIRRISPQIVAYALYLTQLRLGTIMLPLFTGDAEVGYWSAAMRLLELWSFVPWALTASIYPLATGAPRGSVKQNDLIRKMGRRYFWSATALAIPISLGAPWFVVGIYGQEFQSAIAVVQIAAFNLFPWFAYMFWVRLMYIRHTENVIPLIASVYLVIQLVANLWLLPLYGARGAAWASLLSGLLALGVAFAVKPKSVVGDYP